MDCRYGGRAVSRDSTIGPRILEKRTQGGRITDQGSRIHRLSPSHSLRRRVLRSLRRQCRLPDREDAGGEDRDHVRHGRERVTGISNSRCNCRSGRKRTAGAWPSIPARCSRCRTQPCGRRMRLGCRGHGCRRSRISRRQCYLPLCPDFVVELTSPSDRLPDVREKMDEWMSCGCQLGWILHPANREAHIFRPDGGGSSARPGAAAGRGSGRRFHAGSDRDLGSRMVRRTQARGDPSSCTKWASRLYCGVAGLRTPAYNSVSGRVMLNDSMVTTAS